jgi:hypothetical protein
MEFMAEKVIDFLKSTYFGGHACTVLCGVAKDGPFNDELSLASFLNKNKNKALLLLSLLRKCSLERGKKHQGHFHF